MSFIKKTIAVLFLTTLAVSCINTQEKKQAEKEAAQTAEVANAHKTELPAPTPQAAVPSQEELQDQIKEMEKELFASQTLDVNKAKKMIRLYDTYHKNYYKDFVCPDYLFKAGEICENIGQYNRAADFYNMCCNEYNNNFKLRGQCLFRLGNVYDYKLNDYIRAKDIYRQVKEQYPNTQLAKDAEAATKMMGKSDA